MVMMNNDTVSEMCVNNFTYDKLLHISNIVWYVFGFIGVIVGIPGHILQIIITCNKTTRKEPTSLYFIGIAVVELVFLIGVFWLWCVDMSFIKTDPRQVLSCGIFYNILIGSTTLSNLYLASASIDRSIMILYAASYRLIVTRSRVILRLIIITFIVILLLIPRHFYFYYDPRTTLFLCDFYSAVDYRRILLWTLIHAILFVAVPSLIVFITSSILLHNRCKHKRFHKNNLSVTAHRIYSRSLLIFLVSLWLFLSLLPTCILEIFVIHNRFSSHDSYCSIRWKTYKIVLNCFLALLSINYSNKFYFHLMISTAVRKDFIQFITCTSDRQSSISTRMSDRHNNKQCLVPLVDQTKAKSTEI